MQGWRCGSARRLSRLRTMGLNAVQTYVPWNFHELEVSVARMVWAVGRAYCVVCALWDG